MTDINDITPGARDSSGFPSGNGSAASDARAPAPKISFTDAQLAAIRDRGRDLYITAAAGSGKTEVLAERVYRLLCGDAEHLPVPLMRLLVITFTRKAAREMKERIQRKIVEDLNGPNPNEHLRDQLEALPRANIATIHAFCDRLIRAHFHAAGVSPAVRIADDEENREIARQATRDVFTEWAQSDDNDQRETFTFLVSSLPSGGQLLDDLERRVRAIRDFLAAIEDPAAWCDAVRTSAIRANNTARSFIDLDEVPFVARTFAASLLDLHETIHLGLESIVSCGEDAGRLPELQSASAQLLDFARRLDGASPATFMIVWEEARQWAETNAALEKLENKGVCGDEAYHDQACKLLLKKLASVFTKWRDRWFSLDLDHRFAASRRGLDLAVALIDLALAVERRVQDIKRRRGVLGFNDLERKALEVLTDSPPDATGPGPSAIAYDYQREFHQVLVDEYQDISPLQDALIRRLSRTDDPAPEAGRNLFAVGDIKQSIYRFRQAEPDIFIQRLDSAPDPPLEDPGDGLDRRKISLRENFRSRAPILHLVNAVFTRVMDPRVGDIDLDESQLLEPGRSDAKSDASEPSDSNADVETGDDAPPCVEIRWIDPNARLTGLASMSDDDSVNDSDPDATSDADSSEPDAAVVRGIEREAFFIGRRIRELTDPQTGHRIPDREQGSRVARPGDCVILVRGLKNHSETWVSTLARCGVKAVSSGGKAFLTTPEVADLLAALRLADNPFHDLPLATVMRSPLFGFTESDLLSIRMTRRGGPFHQAFWIAIGRAPVSDPDSGAADPTDSEPHSLPDALAKKLARFADCLSHWRAVALQSPAEAVLDAILADTGYEAHVAGGPSPEAAACNLDELRRRLRAWSERASGASALCEFLRSLASGEDDAAPAEDAAPADPDVVQIMTIHKSKGLEFPIVFVASLGAAYQSSSASGLMLDRAAGLFLAGVDPDRRLLMEPLGLVALREEESRLALGEELRLLYVAMTRARELLVMVATPRFGRGAEDFNALLETRMERNLMTLRNGQTVCALALARLSAGSPFELIGPVLHALRKDEQFNWLDIAIVDEIGCGRDQCELPAIHEALIAPQGPSDEAWTAARREFLATFPAPDSAANSAPDAAPTAESNFDSIRKALASATGARSAAPPPPLLLPSDAFDSLSRIPMKLKASELKTAAPVRDTRRAADAPRAAPPTIADDENEAAAFDEEELFIGRSLRLRPTAGSRPRFLQASRDLDATARGSVVHALLQNVALTAALHEPDLRAQAADLLARGLIEAEGPAALEAIPFADLARFFHETDLGRRLRERAAFVTRELPVTARRPSADYPALVGWPEAPASLARLHRPMLVQGIVDAVIDEGDRATLIDYKTDRITRPADLDRLTEIYRGQIDAYRRALASAWRIPVDECYLVFLDSVDVVRVD